MQQDNKSIPLVEKLFILALDKKSGKLFYRSRFALKYAIIAALLFELEEQGRISFEYERLVLKDETPTRDYYQSLILERITGLNKDKKLSWWMSKLSSSYKVIKPKIFKNLINKGYLRKQRDKNSNEIENRYEIWKDTIYRKLKSDLDRIILDNKQPDKAIEILISLVWACRITGNIYKDKKVRLKAKIQSEIFSDGEHYAKSVRKSINEFRFNVVSTVIFFAGPIISKIF